MCGIVGLVDYKSINTKDILYNMTTILAHRGPDNQSIAQYNQSKMAIGLGHARLSILDLSAAGNQPMEFEHLVITYNGEIYNYKEIRNELRSLGHSFKSESDTEVILHAFLEWGVNCVLKFIGMFTFAILDRKTSEITLCKDRAGVKPLYYYFKDDLFMFSSELKAFHKHPRFIKTINNSAVHQYMDYGFVPSPNCIFKDCQKLRGGHYVTYQINSKKLILNKYWDVSDYYKLPRLKISYQDAKIEIGKILQSACDYRMVSDVPVGVFLSGGYDSTAVTAILQSRMSEKLKTFTIGFEEGNNEAPLAKKIAEHLGTDHTEYYCSTKEAQEIIHRLPYYYDEPFADSSAIPTILVSQLAKKSVTVALSADAGDEIFAGYNKYKIFQNNLALLEKIPKMARNSIAIIANISSRITRNYHWGKKLNTLSILLNENASDIPLSLHKSYFALGEKIKNGLFNNDVYMEKSSFNNDVSSFSDSLSIALADDYKFYLQDDILTKVDRATMSLSLEGREPFLDHRLIEFAAQLPIEYKFGETQKRILKDIVHDYIPKKLIDHKKRGFTIPIDSWLKKDLSFLLEEKLNYTNINNLEIFNPSYVETLKSDFYKGRLINSSVIWKLIQFQMWHEKWMD